VRPTPEGALESLVERIDAVAPGGVAPDTVPSGFQSLDRMLGGGFRRQDLIVLGGDVGSGKSALGLAIALRSASAGVPTLVLSGEMSPERMLERALAMEGRAAIDDLRQGRLDEPGRASVGAAAIRLRDVPLLLRPLAGERFEEVTASLDQVPGRSLLVVDSLQLTPAPRPAARLAERVAFHPRRSGRARRDQAERGPRVDSLSRGDVPARARGGGRHRADRGEEPERSHALRGPVLSFTDPSVRGHAGPGMSRRRTRATQRGQARLSPRHSRTRPERYDAGLGPALSFRVTTAPDS
jgi:hypothetical protein